MERRDADGKVTSGWPPAMRAAMHPWFAALLILLAAGIAWTVTRHLRKDWYPSHIIGLGLLILVLLVAAVGYGGARYERGHVNRGEVE